LEKYPDSAYANNAMYNSALAYNELGKFDDAIMTYKKFINAYSDDDKAKGLLVYIAGLYHEQKRYADAVKAYENVMEKGTKEEKLQAIYTIGSIYGSREETEKQIKW
jgi:tetratricopeptide (TPR) repeat protein